jgi:hypothetical protein
MTWTVTFREAWEETMGSEGAVWVALCNTLKPALGNLGYSMILADTVRALFETMDLSVSRTTSLFFITIVALLPLCMLKNLKVLAPFSILGTMVFVLVALVMGVRYLDGTYNTGNGYFVEVKLKTFLCLTICMQCIHFTNFPLSLYAGSSGSLEAFVRHYRHPWCL